ncbi:leucine-rich repeat domain-containing protein, partial [archaeon]
MHFRGFKRIENLDKYTGCKSIWLDSNGFDKIENLTCLAELRCLYLSKNLIGQIEGLDSLKHLTILDLSNNRLSMLENLSCCPSLQTLNVSHNALSSVESIQHLTSCSSLSTLDLTSNRLPADEDIFTVLASMPALVTLSLNGNEVTKLANFRKRLIAKIGRLGYLDRPIDERERLCAEAYVAGGLEAEELARQDWKARQDAKRVKEMEDYKAWQAEHKRAREERRSATG